MLDNPSIWSRIWADRQIFPNCLLSYNRVWICAMVWILSIISVRMVFVDSSRELIRVISSRPDISWRLFLTRWWISRSSTSFSSREATRFSSACLRSVMSRKLHTLPTIPSPIFWGFEYRSKIFPSLNSSMSKLSRPGWFRRSVKLARNPPGSLSCPMIYFVTLSFSPDSSISRGIFHMVIKFWL